MRPDTPQLDSVTRRLCFRILLYVRMPLLARDDATSMVAPRPAPAAARPEHRTYTDRRNLTWT